MWWWRKRDNVEKWIAKLKKRDLNIRREAAETLGEIGDPRAVEPLIKALGDAWYIRWKVEDALVRIGSPAVEALIRVFEKEKVLIRCEVAKVLARIGDRRAVEPLIKALEDENSYIRKVAINALGKIGDTRRLEQLIKAFRDEDWSVRCEVVVVLGEIGDPRAVEPLIRALEDESLFVKWQAAEALVRIGSLAVDSLIEALEKENIPAPVRHKVAEVLGRIGEDRAVEPLIKALENENSRVRATAAEALGKIGDFRAAKPLSKVLGDENEHVRIKVLEAAEKISDLCMVESLSIVLWDKNWYVRDRAVKIIRNICASIDTIIFGKDTIKVLNQVLNQAATLPNLDLSEFTISMSRLERIVIYTETYDFHLVERFITYAVNYIGQEYLKEHVEVHVYGDPDKLHPNLRNSFKNLCKCVEVHERIDI